MRRLSKITLAAAALAACLQAGGALAQEKLRIAVVTPLTGPLASVNVPGQNAARILAEAINAGTLPAPYSGRRGMGGAEVELFFLDENGGNAKQVSEFRGLAERRGADVVMGFGSAATCLAVAPVAEELKVLTVMSTCATPRIFEDASYEYVFRTTAHTTMDSAALALYVRQRLPEVRTVGHINPNFALGQDSWRDFAAAMKSAMPATRVVAEQWPTMGSGQYTAEISALAARRPDLIHTSLTGTDMEAFMTQMSARGLQEQSRIVAPLLELAINRMGRQIPEGIIFTARGTNGLFAPPSALNTWFTDIYRGRHNEMPVFTAYQYAATLLALKAAYDKAAGPAGARPATRDVIAALRSSTFEAPGGTIRMALGNGHQAIQDTAVGEFGFDRRANVTTVRNVTVFPAACVNPPAGARSEAWLRDGMPGADCSGIVNR
ncbi:ABC transporter substrate-binding protein [Muricoccus pecuniae]|uniref:Branched-chain amino acid transport system substrate-binding protein n=1 Tax=Muricoccus pecuniae TaxID=693023 RepID=A0A840Y8Y2_9PROT|nr:ABC transporter substrate-binding protein [Roseomonas pecuniae]MBB5696390.1 branched-chain amino acid transport system substrate-binding protein [Roseomonas pecuniae]